MPEIRRGAVIGLTLLHARFADRLAGPAMRTVLVGYQSRDGALVDAVTETAPVFDDGRLADVPVIDLLTTPVHVLAGVWVDQLSRGATPTAAARATPPEPTDLILQHGPSPGGAVVRRRWLP